MADFLKAYAPLRQFESGWCDVPGDAGGETYAGIARNFFPDWPGWEIIDTARRSLSGQPKSSAMNELLSAGPRLAEMVEDWYRMEWWDRMRLDQFPQIVANELFEQAVNLGRGGSGRYVQRLCNALNYDKRHGRRLFPDLTEDGCLGPKSLSAISALLSGRVSATVFVHALNGLQLAHYVGLGSKNFEHRKFVDGWLSRTYDPQPTE